MVNHTETGHCKNKPETINQTVKQDNNHLNGIMTTGDGQINIVSILWHKKLC